MSEKSRDKQADLQEVAALSAALDWVGSDSANVTATLVNFSQNVLKADRNYQRRRQRGNCTSGGTRMVTFSFPL